MSKGIFVSFEGIEGSGKSTQANFLYNSLLQKGIDAVLTREPGGTDLGDSIRDILLHDHKTYPLSELLLFLADRNQHVNQIIKPFLEKGYVVITDRYYHSTYAYQITGRSIPEEQVRMLNEIAIEGYHPDITFLVDIPPETGFERKKSGSLQLDLIEQESLEFHHSVRKAYLDLARDTDSICLVDGLLDRSRIRQKVWEAFLEKFPRYK